MAASCRLKAVHQPLPQVDYVAKKFMLHGNYDLSIGVLLQSER